MSNTSSFALSDLIEEGVQKLKLLYKSGVDVPTLSMVWGHTCIFVEEQMVKGKAVSVPGLGTFSFVNKKQELGNRGTRITRIPAFVAAEIFCTSHDVRKEHLPNLTGSVATVQLNYSTIASQSGAMRDVVVDFLKEVPKCIGSAVRHNRTVSVELENIGYLVYSPGGTLKVSFNSDFVAQIRVSSSPTKDGAVVSDDQTNFSDSASIVSRSPTKVNNYFSSRPTTAQQEVTMSRANSAGNRRPVILPHMEIPDRPGTPAIKMRANSDPSLRPSTGFSSRYSSIEEESSEDEEEAERQRNLRIEGTEMEKGRRMGEDKRRGNREGEEEEGRREHVHRRREEERRRIRTPEMDRRSMDDEDDECENCVLARIHDHTVQRMKTEERLAGEASTKAQKSVLQAMEEKEQIALKMRRAMREEADMLNQNQLAEKQEQLMKQKKKDFYGNIFYARRPETPAYDKKNQYKSSLEEQIAEKLGQTEQRKVETKKEFELLHETQKQADERARKQKQDEKLRQKEYSEFLMHQIQERTTEPNVTKTPSISRPLSLSPSLSPPPSQDSLRPSTAERALRRRSFDSSAVEQNKEAIRAQKQREAEQRVQIAKQQEEVVKANRELLQQQQQEEALRKIQARELLKTAWNSQLEQKRSTTLEEINKEKPVRNSLDLGELAMMRSRPRSISTSACSTTSSGKHKHNCKKCGRDIDEAASKNFRRTSGDFRAPSRGASTPLSLY